MINMMPHHTSIIVVRYHHHSDGLQLVFDLFIPGGCYWLNPGQYCSHQTQLCRCSFIYITAKLQNCTGPSRFAGWQFIAKVVASILIMGIQHVSQENMVFQWFYNGLIYGREFTNSCMKKCYFMTCFINYWECG